jgi:carotenoid cleavage dioxygenase-like enzyme
MSPSIADPYTSGGFAPIPMECDYVALEIEGEWPADLHGSLYRAGPNPQYPPRGRYNPLLGDGMVHAFHVDGARVTYRNRWVRTQQWTLERAAGRALFATSGDPRDHDPTVVGMRTDGVANTNLVCHGGRLLVLEEFHAPIEIDPSTLETLGVWRFDGTLPSNMTAHPKPDPRSGELHFFANEPEGAFTGELAYYVASAEGAITVRERIDTPFAAIVHDFAITERFVIFPICPVTISMERARAGGPGIAWEPDRLTHVGVMPKSGSAKDLRWFHCEARMAWHLMNAFEDGDEIVVDVCEQAAPAFTFADGTPVPESHMRQYLARWCWSRSRSNAIDVQRLCDDVCEYPRIDERHTGRATRFGYLACCGGPGTGDPFHRGIGCFDFETRRMSVFRFGESCCVSEPVFVPRSQTAAEGDGYLLCTVYDETKDRSCLALLDARRVPDGPVATARLEHRMPMGFHGIWRSAVKAPQSSE